MYSDVYQVTIGNKMQDCETPQAAIELCEATGNGQVVKFADGERSVAMWTLQTGKGWQQHAIFDGYGNPFRVGKPD